MSDNFKTNISSIKTNKLKPLSDEELDKLIQESDDVRFIIKNYLIPEKLWEKIINGYDGYSDEEKDFCTLENIKYCQYVLSKKCNQ